MGVGSKGVPKIFGANGRGSGNQNIRLENPQFRNHDVSLPDCLRCANGWKDLTRANLVEASLGSSHLEMIIAESVEVFILPHSSKVVVS